MALASYAWGYDGGTYNGKDMRQLVEAMFPTPASGVVTGFGVTQQSSPTSTVSVAAGKAIVQATGSGLTGAYHAWNDAALSSPTIDPTTTNGRKDRLILRVSSGVPALQVVKGTAAASPAEPAITGDNYLELALITLPSSTSNITNAMITDRRVYASALRAPIVCTSATRPTGVIEGQVIYETDTDRTCIYNGTVWVDRGNIAVGTSAARPTAFDGMVIYETDTDALVAYDGSGWREYARTGAWQAFTPTLTQSGTVTNTVVYSRYCRTGRMIRFQCQLSVTGSGTSSNEIRVSLPVTPAAGTTVRIGHFDFYDASGVFIYHGAALIAAGNTVAGIRLSSGSITSIGYGDPTYALASGDQVNVDVVYEAAS